MRVVTTATKAALREDDKEFVMSLVFHLDNMPQGSIITAGDFEEIKGFCMEAFSIQGNKQLVHKFLLYSGFTPSDAEGKYVRYTKGNDCFEATYVTVQGMFYAFDIRGCKR